MSAIELLGMKTQHMKPPHQSILDNSFLTEPEPAEHIESKHRRIVTSLPAPCTVNRLADAARLFPQVNCYQPPILWDRADGFQVSDAAGNRWIDFSSTAVMTNTGHGHPAIRAALRDYLDEGLLAQFSFASDVRIELAEKLISLAPPGCEKVYLWTTGSEAIEAAFRLVREWGLRSDSAKYHILTFAGDYHGWTLGAHQLSGDSAEKPWLPQADPAVHHLPFPRKTAETAAYSDADLQRCFDENVQQLSAQSGVTGDQVAAVFIESLQGWGAFCRCRRPMSSDCGSGPTNMTCCWCSTRFRPDSDERANCLPTSTTASGPI